MDHTQSRLRLHNYLEILFNSFSPPMHMCISLMLWCNSIYWQGVSTHCKKQTFRGCLECISCICRINMMEVLKLRGCNAWFVHFSVGIKQIMMSVKGNPLRVDMSFRMYPASFIFLWLLRDNVVCRESYYLHFCCTLVPCTLIHKVLFVIFHFAQWVLIPCLQTILLIY